MQPTGSGLLEGLTQAEMTALAARVRRTAEAPRACDAWAWLVDGLADAGLWRELASLAPSRLSALRLITSSRRLGGRRAVSAPRRGGPRRPGAR